MADRMRQVDKSKIQKQRAGGKHSAQKNRKRPQAQRPMFDQQSAPVERQRSVRSDGMQQIILPMGIPANRADYPSENEQRRREARRKNARKEQRRRKKRRRFFFAALMLLIITAGVVLSSNVLFKVDGYKVVDTEGDDPPNLGIYSEDAILAALNVHLGDNIYGFDPAQKAETMEQSMPYLESVQVRRRLPGTVVVQVQAAVPKYTIQGDFGWAMLSSRLKVMAVQADPFDEELTEIKLPVNTPVAGQRLQISEVPSAVLGEAFAASEAENADSASVAATDAEAQQALEEATQNMQETFDELIALLDKESLLDGINCIDMENLQEITLSYQNRLVIKLGTGNNLPYKLQLTGVIVRNDDGNCLSDSDRGTLDVSYVKKDGTIEPVFRSENDIDITAAISADSQTQEGEENTEDADGTTAPTE